MTAASIVEGTPSAPMTQAGRLASDPRLKAYWDAMVARRRAVDSADLGGADIAVTYRAVDDVDGGEIESGEIESGEIGSVEIDSGEIRGGGIDGGEIGGNAGVTRG